MSAQQQQKQLSEKELEGKCQEVMVKFVSMYIDLVNEHRLAPEEEGRNNKNVKNNNNKKKPSKDDMLLAEFMKCMQNTP